MKNAESQKIMDEYLAKNDPYMKPASLGISIRNVLDYGKKAGKSVMELTDDEVMAFKLKK